MNRMETRPVSWLKPDPKQPRKTFDEAELRLLGETLRERQIQPILARPDGTIIAGERRWRAAMLVGLKELLVIVTEEALSDAEIRAIQLTENVHRAELTGHEKWLACRELLELNPGWQGKDLAAHLHLDPSTVTRLLSPSKCIPEAQEALREGKIGKSKFGISDCYELSQESPERQLELLRQKSEGLSRDALKDVRKKGRNGAASAVRLSRIKIAMPQGASVVVSGADLAMTDLVELLAETLKEARKAAEQYDVKTWQAMMRDRAKAG